MTKAGETQTGRYEGHEPGPTVQIGHQGAKAANVREQFMIEDADLNQLGGRTIETPGAFSFKDAVVIEGVPVDIASALQWERLGLPPEGTVAASPVIPAPTLPPAPSGACFACAILAAYHARRDSVPAADDRRGGLTTDSHHGSAEPSPPHR